LLFLKNSKSYEHYQISKNFIFQLKTSMMVRKFQKKDKSESVSIVFIFNLLTLFLLYFWRLFTLFIKNILFLFHLFTIINSFENFCFTIILQSFLSFDWQKFSILFVFFLANIFGLFSINILYVRWLWIKFTIWIFFITCLLSLLS
jgi:hypothetical protein